MVKASRTPHIRHVQGSGNGAAVEFVVKSMRCSLRDILKERRKAKRVSQLELSLRLGVSQRHISFVESGRSNPSRALLLHWLQELEAPLTSRNNALLAAGYAPEFQHTPLESMSQASEALAHLLKGHEPLPAFVMDDLWNIRLFNKGARWLSHALSPWLSDLSEPLENPNMLDLLLHPDGALEKVTNLAEVGPVLLAQLRSEVGLRPELQPRVAAMERYLQEKLPGRALSAQRHPILTTRFKIPQGEVAFFSMFTTFGTPHDITLASLRVEHLFAADPETLELVTELVGS